MNRYHRSLGVLLVIWAAGCNETTSTDNTRGGGTGNNTGVQTPAGCGNGGLDGLEACDGLAFASGADCATYALGTGTVSCTATCTLDLTGCTSSDYCTANNLYGNGECDACDLLGGDPDPDCTATCGADSTCADVFDPLTSVYTCQNAGLTDPDCGPCDGVALDNAELCDGTFFQAGSAACADFGYRSGDLGCSDDCTPTFDACEFCGNDTVESAEQCDRLDLDGNTCASEGFDGGTLSCSTGCRLDTSACTRNPVDIGEYIEGICTFFDKCSGTMGTAVSSKAECITVGTMLTECEFQTFSNVSQSGLNACGAAFAAASCDSNFDTMFEDICSFEGDRAAAGEACWGQGCATGLTCDYQQSDTGMCASCVPRPTLGQICEYECDSTSWCNQGTCVAPLADGSGCEDADQCTSGLCSSQGLCAQYSTLGGSCGTGEDCGGFYACIGGVCAQRQPIGGSCASDDDCYMTDECGGNGQCVASTCDPSDDLGGTDAPCDWEGECLATHHCQDYTTCQPRIALGQGCADYYNGCAEGTHCAYPDQVCAAEVPLGQSCSNGSCSGDAHCSYPSFICTAKVPEGGACDPQSDRCDGAFDCVSGFCVTPPACAP